MSARGRQRWPAVLGVLCVLLAIGFGEQRVAAQSAGTTGWRSFNLLNDTLALGAMDTSKIVDLTNHRFVTFRVKVIPPAGIAEPWSEIAIRAIGCDLPSCDSNSAGILQLQPVADRSYIASATGDSIFYGVTFTANRLQSGNGEITYRWQRSNATFAFPNAYWFELSNKGQQPGTRYVYLQVRHKASGASGYCKVVVTALVRN